MKTSRFFTAIGLITAIWFSACTNDEPMDPNALPEGKYPLEIASVTMNVESSSEPWSADAPQTRVAENEDRNSSVWQTGDVFYAKPNGAVKAGVFKIEEGGSASVQTLTYWTKRNEDVIAWYPANGEIKLKDQKDKLAYVLKGSGTGDYNTPVELSFEHALAKVRVTLQGDQAEKVTDVKIKSFTSCTHTNGTDIQGSDEGWITMQQVADKGYWEANVVPYHSITKFLINEKNEGTLNSNGITPLAAKVNTITIKVKSVVPEDAKDITGNISDNSNYVVRGTRNEAINITGGSPHIYLDGASINVSDGPAISVTGGTPTIHVIGEGNSVSSGNNTGIAVSGGVTVVIEGHSTADVLTANGGNGGAGIGSPLDGTTAGNVSIKNVTINATGSGESFPYIGGAGIGSSSSGNCGDITITEAVIKANGGAYSAGIGMGYGNTSQPSIGKITITNSDVTAKAGYYAAAIGLPYTESANASHPDYKVGQIIITTDNLETFLSKLTAGGTTNPMNGEYAQRIGKGSHGKYYTPSILNQDGTGSWEGVVINGTPYPDGIE